MHDLKKVWLIRIRECTHTFLFRHVNMLTSRQNAYFSPYHSFLFALINLFPPTRRCVKDSSRYHWVRDKGPRRREWSKKDPLTDRWGRRKERWRKVLMIHDLYQYCIYRLCVCVCVYLRLFTIHQIHILINGMLYHLNGIVNGIVSGYSFRIVTSASVGCRN